MSYHNVTSTLLRTRDVARWSCLPINFLQDHQDAEKVACSSHDVVRATARKLKFYTEIKRREDGFDLTPSTLPQMLFPRLLPRPMLQGALQDISIKHHFTHAQVRCALARIQSSKFPPPNMKPLQREKKIWKIFRR